MKAIYGMLLLLWVCSFSANTQTPSISGFNPQAGYAGTTITINGNNFDPVPANNLVFFGSVKAAVSSASPSQLSVIVPAGASYHTISVTVNNFTCYSSQPFLPTFPYGHEIFTTSALATGVDAVTGIKPSSTSIGDLDNDDKPDMVVTNYNSATFSVFKNTGSKGTASFSTKTDFVTNATPYGVTIADINGDGKPDVVVTNYSVISMSVFINTTSGGIISFAPKIDFTTGAQCISVAVHDIDGDGKPDIMVTNKNSKNFSLFRNNSSAGNFSLDPKINFTTDYTPWGIIVTDIDNDGKPDVAVTNEITGKVSVFQNTASPGIISFNPRVDIITGFSPRGLASVDVDGDGKVDLVTANSSVTANSFSVLRNTSAGGTISFARTDFSSGPGYPMSEHVAIGELTGDSKPDIVVINRSTSTMVVFENKCTPGVIALGNRVTFNTPLNPQGICTGDLDINGKADIVVTSNGANKVTVYRNVPPPRITSFFPLSGEAGSTVTISGYNFRANPLENFVNFGGSRATVTAASDTSLTVQVPFGTTYEPIWITTDRLTTHSNFPFNQTFRGGGSTLENSYAAKVVGGGQSGASDVTIADFDRNGKSDIAVVGPSGVSTSYNYSTPGNINMGGGFGASLNVTGSEITAGDLNGDGYPDIAVSSLDNVVVIFQSNGSGGFTALPTMGIPLEGGSLHMHDLNRDGKPELIVGNAYLTVFPNTTVNGNISFGTAINIDISPFAFRPIIGDFDGDGKTDIIISNTFLKNTSSNYIFSLGSAVTYTTGLEPTELAAGDLNGDGKLDIAAIYLSTNKVVTFLNTSSGGNLSFVRQTEYNTGPLPRGITISDLNGDNKPDLAVASTGYNSVSVFTNISNADTLSFMQKVDYSTGTTPFDVACSDIDGDGKMDIVSADRVSNSVSVLRYNIFTPSPLVPTITSFSPLNGPIETIVTITGTNFSPSTNDNTVYFAGVKAEIVTASSNSLTVKVPPGAGYQSVSITNSNGLTAYSSQPFIVTFAGGGAPFTTNSFEPYKVFPVSLSPSFATTCDMDSDGKLDVVVINRGSNSISVLRNTSNNRFISFAPKIDFATGAGPFDVEAGDLDGDGMLDLVVSNQNSNTFWVYRNTSTSGFISLAAPVSFYSEIQNAGEPMGLSIRDLDGDGKPDVAVSNRILSFVGIFRNTSSANVISFAPKVTYMSGSEMRNVAIDDFDRNGKPDIITTPQVSAFANLSIGGTIAYSAPVTYPVGVGSLISNIASGDLNNDNKPDIAETGTSAYGFSVLRNQSISGTVSFATAVNFGTIPTTKHTIVISDINGDGKPEVTIPAFSSFHLFRNTSGTSTISFGQQINYPYTGSAIGEAVGDFDGDGKQDVLIVNSSMGSVYIFRNKIGEPFRICPGGSITLTSNISGTGHQWQLSTDSINFSNISDNAFYTGTNTETLQLNNIPGSFSGYRYRCVSSSGMSELFILRFGNTWTGAANNQWEDPANWSCSLVPDMFTDVIIHSGAVVVLNSNTTIASLTLRSNATFTVNSGFTLDIIGN